MESFKLEIESDIIISELLYLVQYGSKEHNLPCYLSISVEDTEDYICELKNILIEYFLLDYFKDAMNKYLNEIITRNTKSY